MDVVSGEVRCSHDSSLQLVSTGPPPSLHLGLWLTSVSAGQWSLQYHVWSSGEQAVPDLLSGGGGGEGDLVEGGPGEGAGGPGHVVEVVPLLGSGGGSHDNQLLISRNRDILGYSDNHATTGPL